MRFSHIIVGTWTEDLRPTNDIHKSMLIEVEEFFTYKGRKFILHRSHIDPKKYVVSEALTGAMVSKQGDKYVGHTTPHQAKRRMQFQIDQFDKSGDDWDKHLRPYLLVRLESKSFVELKLGGILC